MFPVVDPIAVVPYDAGWSAAFLVVARRLRGLLGSIALRVDHIGSTAVFGLDAKPVIDVQVSVAALEPHDIFSRPLKGGGFVFDPENPERTKRYFREPPGERRTHIHVRRAGSFSEQLALLFRDYLRQNGERAKSYGELKRVLAVEFRHDRQGYVDAKGAFFWETIRLADAWAQGTGWEPGPSDA